MTHLHRGVRMSLLVLVALSLSPAARLAAQAAETCTVREADRWPVRLEDGTYVYVEPVDLVELDGRLLLAGTPTYEVPPDEVGPDAKFVRNGIAGVMLEPGRRARRVPWPLADRHLKVLRSATDPAGGWLTLFAELDGPSTIPETGNLIGLWYGRWDGERWAEVDSIPMPPRPEPKIANTSSVVRHGSGFAWALPFEGEMRDDRGAVVLFREDGSWHWEIIYSRHGVYAELWERNGELSAALVTTLGGVRRDRNSLLLYRRDPEWREDALLVRGLDDVVHKPLALRSGDRVVLTWLSYLEPDWRLQAYLDVPADTTEILTIDPSMSRGDALRLAEDHVVWAWEHVEPDDARTVRLADEAGSRIRALGEIASPYTGRFAAERSGDGAVLLAGPRLSKDPQDVTLLSLILRIEIDCEAD